MGQSHPPLWAACHGAYLFTCLQTFPSLVFLIKSFINLFMCLCEKVCVHAPTCLSTNECRIKGQTA